MVIKVYPENQIPVCWCTKVISRFTVNRAKCLKVESFKIQYILLYIMRTNIYFEILEIYFYIFSNTFLTKFETVIFSLFL